MNKNSLTRVESTSLAVSTENAGLLKEERFRKELTQLRVDCVNSDYKKIMAFNRMFDREFTQHHLFEEAPFSYITDIDNKLLIDNNIYIRHDSNPQVIHGTIYVIIDHAVTNVEAHMKRFADREEKLRVYININDFLSYSSVAGFVKENYPEAEIISINETPGHFNSDMHYHHSVPKTFIPWEQNMPGKDASGRIPFLMFSGERGDIVDPYYTCIYAMMNGEEIQTNAHLMEQVGLSAASLLLEWEPEIKTITEHYNCCSEISDYLVFLKHFTVFGGRISRVTLDITYQPDIFSDAPRQTIVRKGVRGLDLSEPTDGDIIRAISKDVRYCVL